MESFNGIGFLEFKPMTELFTVDACLSGIGGFYNGRFYHREIPAFVLNQSLYIVHYEMLSLYIAIRLWSSFFHGCEITVSSDNEDCVNVLNHGRSRDSFLLNCARAIWLISAEKCFLIKATYITSKDNKLSDCCSRWHLNPTYKNAFLRLTKDFTLVEEEVPDEWFLVPSWI